MFKTIINLVVWGFILGSFYCIWASLYWCDPTFICLSWIGCGLGLLITIYWMGLDSYDK